MVYPTIPCWLQQRKKNPKSHKSIKGNNSKQREGNDPGLLLLKGGEKHVHACSFSSFCLRHTSPRATGVAHLGVAAALAKQNQGRSLIKQVIPCCDNSKCGSAFTQPRLQCTQPWLRSRGLAVTHHLMSKAHCCCLPGDNLLLA